MEIRLFNKSLGFVEGLLGNALGELMESDNITFGRVVLTDCQEIVAF